MFSAQTFKKGFTLIELMIVMAVIAILATIAFFGFGKAQASARDTSRQQAMNGVRATLEKFFGDKAYYPGPGLATKEWTGDTSSLIDTLVADKYLDAGPTDPCRGGTPIPNNGVMGATDCAPAAYAYAPTKTDLSACTTAAKDCAKYTLTLTKEGGGTSNFVSPR